MLGKWKALPRHRSIATLCGWFLTKSNPTQMFPLVFEIFWKAGDGWSATWSLACCRCSFYLFGERDFLFVYLKKFSVKLHRLHAWRFMLSAPCTLQCPGDLNHTQLPGCADRWVPGQHCSLGSAPAPSRACLCLIWHLPSSPQTLLCLRLVWLCKAVLHWVVVVVFPSFQ